MIDSIAVIDEELCIGCTHCRMVCPFDAIVGGHQFIHTIITSECTGCEICIARCEQLQRAKELLEQKERMLQTGSKVIQDILERSKK